MFAYEVDQRLAALRDSLPGQVFGGSDGRSYPLADCIGEGGQGWIFRATWNGSVDVVVKVLRPDIVSKDTLARFQREANVLRTMSQQPAPNPHVVRFYDHACATLAVPGTTDVWTVPFTVLEFVEGETLADTLAKERGNGLGLARSRSILRHIVLALRDVHAQNIVHRDLKPSNVLIDTASGRELAKVTDFGLAKVFQGDLHRTTALAGATVGYAPPEQFEQGNKRVGRPTDIFSLAAIFYELLTGEAAFPLDESAPPFLALQRILLGNRPTFARIAHKLPSEVAANPGVVAALDVVLARALASDPGQRYPTVTEFHDAIEDAIRPVAGHPTSDSASLRAGARVSAPPSIAESPTLLADDRTMLTGPPAFSSVRPGLSDYPPSLVGVSVTGSPDGAQLQWQMISPPVWRRPMSAVALSSDSGDAVAIGPEGLGHWSGRTWTRLELPSDVVPRTLETVAWLGKHVVVAGASPVVRVRAPDGSYAAFVFNLPGIAFHGAFADPAGVLLAGERAGPGGRTGVLAMMSVQSNGMLSLAWVDVPQAGPLRAVTRLDRVVLACGDGGVVAAMQGGRVQSLSLCAQPLLALVPTGDGAAIAVGGGGFVFRLQRTLDARLEAIQTTRTLLALARGPDGALYCGGEDRRVLRRTLGSAPAFGPSPAPSWARAGATAGVAGAAVRALSAAPDRVVAFCDDGSVLEGVIPAAHRTMRGTG